MFGKINYRTETRFEPIRVIRVKPENKKNLINEDEGKSILELMKDMNKS